MHHEQADQRSRWTVKFSGMFLTKTNKDVLTVLETRKKQNENLRKRAHLLVRALAELRVSASFIITYRSKNIWLKPLPLPTVFFPTQLFQSTSLALWHPWRKNELKHQGPKEIQWTNGIVEGERDGCGTDNTSSLWQGRKPQLHRRGVQAIPLPCCTPPDPWKKASGRDFYYSCLNKMEKKLEDT